MKIILSAAVSVDGHIDDVGEERLILSHPEDLKEVYDLRDSCDAILVGAHTIRRDNPSLSPSAERQQKRRASGLAPEPIKVTMTRTGLLSPESKFFQDGAGDKIIYAPGITARAIHDKFRGLADVVPLHDHNFSAAGVVRDLETRGVKTLLVEGGTDILTQFLSSGLADEMRLAMAPLFVGQADAPRLVKPGFFPHHKDNRMKLHGVRRVGDMAVMHYALDRTT